MIMGLFDMVKEAAGAAQNLGELDDLYKEFSTKLTAAHKAGKLDGKIWDAFETISGKDGKFDLSDGMQKVEDFAKLLKKHGDKIPEDLKPAVEKLNAVVGVIDKAQGLLGKN